MHPPRRLWLVRHGESAGNVARQRAYDAGEEVIDLDMRDMDVPLTALGEQQARSFGRWLRAEAEPPTVVYSSPYVRASETARILLDTAGLDVPIRLDERLRDRDFGILDRLTGKGIAARHPEQSELRARLGKFYYRPPGGEAWTDVALRMRGVLDDLRQDHAEHSVMLVAHDMVVLCLRYLLEEMTEQQVLRISAESEVGNCSLTAYDDGVLTCFNNVVPLEDGKAPLVHRSEPEIHA